MASSNFNYPVGVYTDSLGLAVNGDIAPGPYFLIGWVDYQDNYLETDENNNTKHVAVNILQAQIDLVADSAVLDTTSVRAGENILLTGNITNNSTGDSPGGKFRILISEDTIVDGSDEVLEDIFLPFLSPGTSYAINEFLDIDPFTPPGDHFILIDIDRDGDIPETDETNNVTSLALTVEPTDIDLLSDDAVLTSGYGHGWYDCGCQRYYQEYRHTDFGAL